MPAGPFAAYLREARERSGLTQAALAEQCHLTGSYISLLESGKKPAPSDRVVRRLAAALSLDEKEALHRAHLDRAPDELRRSVELLHRQAALEKQMRERTAEALFPTSLWLLQPASLPHRVGEHRPQSIGASIVEVIDRLLGLARSSPDLPTFESRTREVLASLPEEERRRVIEAGPGLVQRSAEAPASRLLPAPGEGFPPEVLPGDTIVVRGDAAPAAGDLVFVEEEGGPRLRRFEPGLEGVTGVVVEVRRPLRRP